MQNLSRLDESNEEDAKGVNTTMGVLENLLEVILEMLILGFSSHCSVMYPDIVLVFTFNLRLVLAICNCLVHTYIV